MNSWLIELKVYSHLHWGQHRAAKERERERQQRPLINYSIQWISDVQIDSHHFRILYCHSTNLSFSFASSTANDASYLVYDTQHKVLKIFPSKPSINIFPHFWKEKKRDDQKRETERKRLSQRCLAQRYIGNDRPTKKYIENSEGLLRNVTIYVR